MIKDQSELEKLIALWPMHTIAEIAAELSTAELNITPREVTITASNLRANDVPLADKRCKPAPDYEALARVAREAI